jgi:HEAT repeat protein
MHVGNSIEDLLRELRTENGAKRQHAREALVAMNKAAAPTLIALLTDENERVRWEACKALGAIKDPTAAGPFVEALRDPSIEIEWLAAEGLIALGECSLVPLLRALKIHFESLPLRQGAHHVLHALHMQKLLDTNTVALLDTLRSLGPEVAVAPAAQKALDSISKGDP